MSTASTKDKIIRTATVLFWQNGYKAVSVDNICKNADVRKGSFYHFFASKEALALCVLELLMQEFEENVLKKCFSNNIPPLERFSRYADVMDRKICMLSQVQSEVHGCPFGNFAAEMVNHSEDIRKKAEEIFISYAEYFRTAIKDAQKVGLIRKDIKAKLLAKILLSAAQGITLLCKVEKNSHLFKERFDLVIKLLHTQPDERVKKNKWGIPGWKTVKINEPAPEKTSV